MIVVHDGPADSVHWIASRLQEAAQVAAADPDARLQDRREAYRTTADAEVVGRRLQHEGSFSMETTLHLGWDGDRRVRIALVRGSSARNRIELPLPPGPVASLIPDAAATLAALAAAMKRAVVLRTEPRALLEALDRFAGEAAVVRGAGSTLLRVAARTPWHPPEAETHDHTASTSPLCATAAGVALLDAAVPVPALRMTDRSDGTHALSPLRVGRALGTVSVLDAMRAIAQGGTRLCAPEGRRRRTW